MRPISLSLSAPPSLEYQTRPLPATSRELVRALGLVGVTLIGIVALAWLVRLAGPVPVLAGVTASAVLLVMAVRPTLATILVVLLIYTNVPVLASRQGVPKLLASSVVLLLALPVLHAVIARGAGLRTDPIVRLMLLYLAVLAASALGVRNIPLALEYIQTFVLEGLVLYVLIVNAVRDLAALRQVIGAMLAAGTLLGMLTTYQEVTGSYSQQFGGLAQRNYEYLELRELAAHEPELREALRNAPVGGRSRRPGGPVSEPNRFAQILIVLLPFALWTFRTARTAAGRCGAAVAGVFVLAGLVFSDSRGAFLALLCLTGAATYFRWLRGRHVALVAAAFILLIPLIAPRYVQRVMSLGAVAQLSGEATVAEADGAIRGRLTEMLAAGQAFLDYPLLGVGPGQYAQMYSVEYHFRNDNFRFRDLPSPRRAHSLYLELGAETGLLGVTVFFWIVWTLVRNLWRLRTWTITRWPAHADLMAASVLSLGAYLLTAVFLHLSYVRYYWLLVAVCSAACHVVWTQTAAASALPAPVRVSDKVVSQWPRWR